MARSTPVSSTGAGKVHKKTSADNASTALKQLAGVEPAESKPQDLAKQLGFGAIPNKMLQGKANTLHLALAIKFHNEILAPDRQSVLDELLEGTDPDSERPWNLSLLLAEGSQGIILHILLDPSQFLDDPLQYSFCRLRAFISLLLELELEPSLLRAFNSTRRTPLHCLIFSSSSEDDGAATQQTLKTSKEAIIKYLCVKENTANSLVWPKTRSSNGRSWDERQARAKSFRRDSDSDGQDDHENLVCAVYGGVCSGVDGTGRLCCSRDSGSALDAALGSLKEVAVMGNGLRFHAVHAAIEEGIAFPTSVMDALGACFTVPDSFGRTCLHLAVSMPFTDAKIQWARSLARMCPGLLATSCEVVMANNKKKKVTPLQYLAEQRMVDPKHTTLRMQSYQSGQDYTRRKLDTSTLSSGMDVKLSYLEDDLKLHCLWAFEDGDLCRKYMYTENNEKEIDFPLEDITISKKTLDSLCQHYRPDRQLKSVTIANVQIEWDVTSKAYKDTEQWECAGNTDLYLVFNWLKQTQCVKKVFQVSVRDFAEQSAVSVWRPHSDKAIVECLKNLNVETWDWQRLDIPCSAIEDAAGSTVKTLYLYSSGLDAVLESWSAPGGLPRLRNLENIYLFAHQGLESLAHAKSSAETFKTTIKKNFLEVNKKGLKAVEFAMVEARSERHDDGDSSSSANDHETNEWLNSMDQFATFMDLVGKGDSKAPVKVALIDDGVKSSYRGLDDNILCGRSWPAPKTEEAQSKVPRVTTSPKYNNSRTGHGTIMAWYIRRMCPSVKLCVAKLDPVAPGLTTGDEKVTFTVQSVIDAIWWAIGKEVDIISMSWAIDDNMPSDVKRSLSLAVRAALDRNILIFCANPDKGAEDTNNQTYPYQLAKENVFCIGAAGRNGKRWDWIDAKDKSCTYLLPGVDLDIHVETVQPFQPTPLQPILLAPIDGPLAVRSTRERRKQSGSSLACALASGLAAMILHCSRVAGADGNDIDYLRTYGGMKSALDSLYPDGGAAATAAGEGQWLPVSALPGGKGFNHSRFGDKRMGVLEDRVSKFLEKMPEDYISSVPPRVSRQPTMAPNSEKET